MTSHHHCPLRFLVEQTPSSIEIYDRDGLLIQANAAWSRLWKVPNPEAFIGRYNILEDPQIAARGYDVYIRRALSGETVHVPAAFFDPAESGLPGRQRWTDLMLFPLRDTTQRISHFAVCHEDVTEHVQVRSELDVFRRFTDASVQGCAWAKLDGVVAYANPALERLLGSGPESSLVGRHLTCAFDGSVHTFLSSVILPEVVSGSTWVGELPARRTSSAVTPVQTSLFAIRDEAGGPAFLGVMFSELSERTRTEVESAQAERQLLRAQKLESLGVLAGGIAHDFNNLLCGVLGSTDLALQTLDPNHPAREDLELAVEAAQRATELCRQMLAYSGRGQFVVEPIDISRLVHDMASLLKASVSKKAVLEQRLSPSLPMVQGDAAQIRQIVINLVMNASEALGDGPGTVTVSTGAAEFDQSYLSAAYAATDLAGGWYTFIEVSDTGAGMDAETTAKAFDPFFSTKFTGRGLGLAATLGIVRGHRGAIRVRSEPGRGSSFSVLFPCTPRSTVTQPESSADARPSQGRILIVDDEPSVRAVGERMLTKLGFGVTTAADGPRGVELFTAEPNGFALVLLDMMMPGLDGEQVFRMLRRVRPDVRVVLMSGYNEHEATHRFAGRSLQGFLAKPFRLEALASCVRSALAKQ